MSYRHWFRLRLRVEGYYWQCPSCGYSQERAMCHDGQGREWHMQAGDDGEWLMSSVLGWCRNCARARRTL